MAKSLTLSYQFTADTGDFKKKLDEVRAQLQKAGVDAKTAGQIMSGALEKSEQASRKLAQSLSLSQKVMGALAGGFAAGAISQGLYAAQQAASKYLQSLRDIGEASKRAYTDPAKVSALVSVGARNGVSEKDVVSGFNALGKKANDEFREGEGELSKLLEANNLKITDRAGRLKSTNDLLTDAAGLIQNAGTEFDKIKIAELFGLSEDWVKVLEKGPDALRKSTAEAEALGGAFDREMVARAKDFDAAWSNAWVTFSNYAKASIVEAGTYLAQLANQARDFINSQPGAVLKRQQADALGGAAGSIIGGLAGGGRPVQGPNLPPEQGPAAPPAWWTGKSSVVPTGGKSGGGGGGGSSGLDGIERYAAQLEKVRDSLKTQVELWGKSNQEQAVALNLIEAELRAKREGRALTETEKTQVRDITITTESYRQKLKDLKDQQAAVADAARTMGDAISGALEDLIFNGGKASDVMKRLAQTIATSALRSLLTGEGGFGGLFGTAGKDGKAGGLLGNVFSGLFSNFGGFKASGGGVTRGKSYVVGENGPEMFMAGENGTIVPNGGGGVTGSGVPIVNVHNYANTNVQVKQSKGPNGPTIDVMLTELVLRDVSQRGPISQALGARRF
jgi:hypothetical protein